MLETSVSGPLTNNVKLVQLALVKETVQITNVTNLRNGRLHSLVSRIDR